MGFTKKYRPIPNQFWRQRNGPMRSGRASCFYNLRAWINILRPAFILSDHSCGLAGNRTRVSGMHFGLTPSETHHLAHDYFLQVQAGEYFV